MTTRTANILTLTLLAGCSPTPTADDAAGSSDTDDGETEQCASIVPVDASICAVTRTGLVAHRIDNQEWVSRLNGDGTLEPLFLVPVELDCLAWDEDPIEHDPATGKLWWLKKSYGSLHRGVLHQFDIESGALDWLREYDDVQHIFPQQIRLGEEGLYLAGTMIEESPDLWWVARLDSVGMPIWTQTNYPTMDWVGPQVTDLLVHTDGLTFVGHVDRNLEAPAVVVTLHPDTGEQMWAEFIGLSADPDTDAWVGSDGERLYSFRSRENDPVDVLGVTPLGQGLWASDDFPMPDLPPTSRPSRTWATLGDSVVQISAGSGAGVPLHFVQWAADGTVLCETDFWVPILGSINSLQARPAGDQVVLGVNLDEPDVAFLLVQPTL